MLVLLSYELESSSTLLQNGLMTAAIFNSSGSIFSTSSAVLARVGNKDAADDVCL
jgi:hypothetical protein